VTSASAKPADYSHRDFDHLTFTRLKTLGSSVLGQLPFPIYSSLYGRLSWA